MADGPLTGASDRRRALEQAALGSVEGLEHEAATQLAVELLRQDPTNAVAHRVLASVDVDTIGEVRRLTILFCDLVGSTRMSGRHDPSDYHRMLRRYHRMCDEAITAHGGTVNNRAGDGVLALFGHPRSHEDDTRRAVRAGLALTREVADLRPEVEQSFGESLEVRVAIHLGLVHLDLLDSAIYGQAPNVAARLQDLAAPGMVVVSDEVREVVGGFFITQAQEARAVKGVDRPIGYHIVEGELPQGPQRGRSWHTPFVGRHGVRQALRHALGEGSPAVVRGEPGIGKSRLVAETLADLEVTPPQLITILCTEYDQTTDLGAASELLRLEPAPAELSNPTTRLAHLRDGLVSLGLEPDVHLGLLAPLLGLAASAGYVRPEADPTRVHHQVLTSLRAWLAALGARHRVMLLVEDVQWADSGTCELLVGLVRHPLDGVRLVATERTGSIRLHGRDLVAVDVAALSAEESAALACAVDDDIGPDRLAVTLSRGQGNPLFLEELAREPGSASVDPELLTRLMNESVVPGALYEPLLARLYASGADVGLAQAAATIGRSFSRDVLTHVAARPSELLDLGLRSLLDAGLLDVEDDGVYWFRHTLMRDVAYDLQPREQRIALHGRVGDALRSRHRRGADVSSSVIATHYHAAGRVDDAIDAYAAAAEASRERGSLAVGIDHLSAAIDLLDQSAPDRRSPQREVDLRLRRGFLCVSTGGNADPRAVSDYERCLHLAQAEDDEAHLVSTLVALWAYHTARGDLTQADRLLDEIVVTGITDDPVRLSENRTARGMVRFFQGDFGAAEHQLSLAIEGVPEPAPADRPPSPWEFPNDPIAAMHVLYGLARWQRGDLEAFRHHLRRAHHRSEQLPRPDGPFNHALALTYQAWVLSDVGDHEGARQCTDELLDIAERYGFDFWALTGTTADAVTRGRSALAAGTVDAALLRDQANRLAATATATEVIETRLLLPYGLTAQAELIAAAGDHEEALAVLGLALSTADATGSQFYRAETHRLRAHTRAALGDALALEDLHLAAETAQDQGSIPFELRARLDLAEWGLRSDRLDELEGDQDYLAAAGVGARDQPSRRT